MYDRIAGLKLEIETAEFIPLQQKIPGFTRKTTVIKLIGNGFEGMGEDVTYDPKAQTAFQKDALKLDLAGQYSVQSFSDKIASLNLFRAEPWMPVFRHYRQWGFESAALSLALKQSDKTLAGLIGRELKPLNFVASKDLSKPRFITELENIKSVYPKMRFKVDVSDNWTDKTIERLGKLDAIDVFDFKAYYKGVKVERTIKPSLYKKVATIFPDALLEDPAVDDKTKPILKNVAKRVTWDAPLHSLEDLLAMPFRPEVTNIKPSRFGTLKELFKVYEYCLSNNIKMYGGGQFELGHGRHQIQYLASLMHPNTPNDVAPGGFNKTPVEPGLPTPPLKIKAEF